MIEWSTAVATFVKQLEVRRVLVGGYEKLLKAPPKPPTLDIDASHDDAVAAIKDWRPFADETFALMGRTSEQLKPLVEETSKEALQVLSRFVSSAFARQAKMFWTSLADVFDKLNDWLEEDPGAERSAFEGQVEPLDLARSLQSSGGLRELCSKEALQPLLDWCDAHQGFMATLKAALPTLAAAATSAHLSDPKFLKLLAETHTLKVGKELKCDMSTVTPPNAFHKVSAPFMMG